MSGNLRLSTIEFDSAGDTTINQASANTLTIKVANNSFLTINATTMVVNGAFSVNGTGSLPVPVDIGDFHVYANGNISMGNTAPTDRLSVNGHLSISNGGIKLNSIDIPTAPATNTAIIFSDSMAGRIMTGQIGPSGVDYEFQPLLGRNKVISFFPNAGVATFSLLGQTTTTTGTATARVLASTSFLTTITRVGFVSSATAGSSAGLHPLGLSVTRGSTSGQGGFWTNFKFGIAATVAGTRMFIGLRNAITVIGNVEPNTLTDIVGIGCLTTQSTLSIYYNDASGTASAIPLGASFPVTNNAVYTAMFFSAPNGSEIGYKIERLDTAAVAEGTFSTDIPSNTTFLGPHVWINNGATAAATAVDLINMYVETDH